MTGSIHEALLSAWMTRSGSDTSATTYFGLIRDTTIRDTLEWTTESTSYSLIERSLACTWCPKIGPWSTMSEVWEGEDITKELSNGRAHHWKVKLVGLPATFVDHT